MNPKPILFSVVLATALVAAPRSTYAQGATATIGYQQVGSVYNYTITMTDSGSTSLQGFWYAWTLSGNNLPSGTYSNLNNSLGWTSTLFGGDSIQYQGNSGNALQPGQSGTFTFSTTVTPAAITTSPSGESVAYVGTIGFNQNSPGVSTPVFSPVLVVPEPSSLGLLSLGLIGFVSRKLRRV